MKPCEFVGLLFLARDITHSVHLNTRSFSKHVALDSFYNQIIPLVDTFVEAYQGRHGLIGDVCRTSVKKVSNVTEFLKDQLDEIESDRYNICDKTDTSLQNVIDEIVQLYLITLYKLKFLN